MKQIIITCMLSISVAFAGGYFYIQSTSQSELISIIKSFKNDTESKKGVSNSRLEEKNNKSDKRLIEVLDVKTGYHSGNIWYPSVIVRFKNISGENLKQYIKSKVVFIDNATDEQIGVHTKYLCTSNEVLLKDISIRKQFKSDVGYRGSYTSLNISLKIYLENDLIGTYKVSNNQI